MQVHRVHQQLVSSPLLDVEAEVHRQLDSLGITPPAGEVAITAGSRGIDNIADHGDGGEDEPLSSRERREGTNQRARAVVEDVGRRFET